MKISASTKNVMLICSLVFLFIYLYAKKIFQGWLEAPAKPASAPAKPASAPAKPPKVVTITSVDFKSCELSSDKSIECLTKVAPADFYVIQEAGIPISQIGAPTSYTKILDVSAPYNRRWVVLNHAYKDNKPLDPLGFAEAIRFDRAGGFAVESTKTIQIGGVLNDAIVVVHGHFGGDSGKKFTIANIRSDWNEKNFAARIWSALQNFATHMKEFRTSNKDSKFVLIGRFSLRDAQVELMATEMQKTYGAPLNVPKLPGNVFSEPGQKYSLDHVITDIPCKKLEMFQTPCHEYANAIRVTLEIPQ